jgi:uncharacterized protein DUF2019
VELWNAGVRRHLEWGYPLTPSIEELAALYRSTAVAWGVVQSDSKKANELFTQLHGIFKSLRQQQAGRDSITALLNDREVAVRLMAASHALAWEPTRATSVLEAIEREGPGLYRTDAKYTLKSFREGKLNMDW